MTISASSPASASTPAATATATSSHEPSRNYMIRTDVHYAPETNLLTAMFEIPGVKKADLSVSLRVCPYSRVKRLRVTGKSQPAFADHGYSLRERKYGSFQRDIIVPQETTSANLSATLQDGVLILTMPGGTRVAGEEEVSEIPVN
ncbi:hypothetical protein BD410DRAFT_719224 [Rickenella mellea]|uniref:SHSP domain-containing protein n=1 Tax=Rickenella mellea TaxID=50990 RepID=A0A4Y7Q9V6_9AGAM|nr:hypothetical protein BD410DRAFT_719224 [Rickenella mellea]